MKAAPSSFRVVFPLQLCDPKVTAEHIVDRSLCLKGPATIDCRRRFLRRVAYRRMLANRSCSYRDSASSVVQDPVAATSDLCCHLVRVRGTFEQNRMYP